MRALITALAAGLACLASPAAGAQQASTQEDEGLWCVYEALTGSTDYEIVAEAYLFDDDKTGDPGGVLEIAGKNCAEKLKLSEVQKLSSMEYGRLGAAIDYLVEEMMWEGLTEEDAVVIFDLVDQMSDDDYEALFEDGWQAGSVGTSVRAKLLAADFPAEEGWISLAMDVMSLSVLADEAEFAYFME